LAPLEFGKEVLAPEALVGPQKHARGGRDTAQTIAGEAGGDGRGGRVAVTKLAVQPLAGLRDEQSSGCQAILPV
jgi:hypothetical protein